MLQTPGRRSAHSKALAVNSSLLTTEKATSVDDKVASVDGIIKPDYTAVRGKLEERK